MNSAIELVGLFNDGYLAGGFGINTDLLETNVINLAVVIGILTYFGRDVVSTLLKNRKQKLLDTIRTAEEDYQDSVNKLNKARERFQESQAKAIDIHASNAVQVKRERQERVDSKEADVKRADALAKATFRFQEQRAAEDVRQSACQSAFNCALNILHERLNSDLHLRIIDYQIDLLNRSDKLVD